MFNPDSSYFSFYLWNICLFFLINLNYYLNITLHCMNNKLPGYKIRSNKICPICLEEGCNWSLPCKHYYHKKCIKKWFDFNKSCPYCRKFYFTNS